MKTSPPPCMMPILQARRHNASDIAAVAGRILRATAYLTNQCDYSLDQLQNLTGGGSRAGVGCDLAERLHKNSIIKIRDLRVGYTVRLPSDPHDPQSRKHWIEADEGATSFDGSRGRYQWMWNPQVDTIEKLERILHEAIRMGFERATAPRSPRAKIPTETSSEASGKAAAKGTGKAARKTSGKAAKTTGKGARNPPRKTARPRQEAA